MLNSNRWLNICIFHLEQPISIGGQTLLAGIQQLIRIENTYFFNQLGKPVYVELNIQYNEEIVNCIFSKAFRNN
ncbi:hypothetical protein GW796_08895 [archaeon]|nr:hypothetical protein [archaeon]NCQ51995.1 hypothetical protein [archaeon]